MSALSTPRRVGLRALRTLAGSPALDRLGARRGIERALYRASRSTVGAAAASSRVWRRARRLGAPARQQPRPQADLFDLTPTEEQQMLVEATRELAEQVVRPAAKEADKLGRVPEEVRARVAELGLTALGVPEELGGPLAERSAVSAVLAYEALGWGDLGIAASELAAGAVATALGLWGDADQQGTYLEPFGGEQPPLAALALAEPAVLADPLRPSTVARRRGEGWVVEGEKALVLRGGEAELFLVSAQREDGRPGLFVVEPQGGGVAVEPAPAMGLRAASTARLRLEGAKVGPLGLLGEGDPAVVEECVARARIAWCALALGCAQAVLDYVIPYVKERKAFGEPIANRQAVAFMVANIAIELEGMRLASWRAASLADQGRPFAKQAATARLLCARRGMQIGSDGVQLLGGHGYVKEHPVERWYRDLRAIGVVEGGLLV